MLVNVTTGYRLCLLDDCLKNTLERWGESPFMSGFGLESIVSVHCQ
jgi:hypothetical protein